MKMLKIIAVCTCLIAVTQPAWSQKAATKDAASPGILGFLDPRTGAFRPVAQQGSVDSEEIESLAATTGKFVFNFTVTLTSTNLGSDTFVCDANASVFDTNGRSIQEAASVAATGTGSTRKCTVTIPYSWTLVNTGSTDMVNLSIVVLATGPTASAGQPTREHNETLVPIKVPLTGSTTTETIAVTL